MVSKSAPNPIADLNDRVRASAPNPIADLDDNVVRDEIIEIFLHSENSMRYK